MTMAERPEFQSLADHLRVLANPNRLELLYELRSPKSVDELELTPEQVREGENPERPISHQAIRKHLSKLASIDVVATEARNREGRLVDEYVVNHQRLFAIVEEFRSLGELEPERSATREDTISADRETDGDAGQGPRLVVVRGRREGRAFPLDEEARLADRGWVVGRKQGLSVCLDYDPFVSAENTVLERAADGFQVRDLPASRNGTFLNFEQLPPGGSATLSEGDVIGVGRTNLVFRR
jgi:pSer/pThr/pTyr-binding forkhead associated (FHA) protein